MAILEMDLAVETNVELLPINLISTSEDNPRRTVGDVAELAASIRAAGVIEPLVVTPSNGGYSVVCGARRLAGARAAGLEHVPAIVREFEERERQEVMLIENLQRENLSALEEAGAFARLVELGLSQRKLAERIGRSQSHVSKRLALLELPAQVRTVVDSGGITLDDALGLLKLKDQPARLKAAWKQSGGRDIDWAVRKQLEERRREVQVEAARAKLKKAGVRQVELVKDKRYGTLDLPAGHRVVQKGGGYSSYGRGDALAIDPKAHAKESCHGAVVGRNHNAGEIVYVCTNPKRHPEAVKKAGRSFSNQKSQKRRAHEKALSADRRRRREFVGELLGARHAKAEVLELLVGGLLRKAGSESTKIACELLGLEPIRRKNTWGGQEQDFRTPLDRHADKGEKALLEAGLAVVFAELELSTQSTWRTWKDLKPYFDFLESHGYELSSTERLELAGKAPRPNF